MIPTWVNQPAMRGGGVAVGGVNATTYPIAPTVQYHPNTAASIGTLGGASTFTGSFDGTTNILTLTADAVGTFALGQNLTSVASRIEGNRIQTQISGVLGKSGSTYRVSKTPSFAVSSQPMSSDGANIVLSMTDNKNYAPLTSAPSGAFQPPRLMTDALGRKFLRFSFAGTDTSTTGGTFMQNLADALNLDSHNMTWLFTGRVHNFKGGTVLSLGINGQTGAQTPAGSTLPQLGAVGCAISPVISVDANYICCQRDFAARGFPAPGSPVVAPPTNANRLIAGTQMQVFGSSTSTTDGLGGTTTTVATRLFHNEQTADFAGTPYTSNSITRYKGVQGFEVGRWSKTLTQSYSLFDLYELSGWLNDELAAGTTGATRTNTVTTNAQAARNAMLTNFAIPTITDSVVLVADSRGEFGSITGTNVGMLLTDPGSVNALPATTRFISNAWGGGTHETHWANMLNSPYSIYSQGMLGGGHDKAIIYFGVNDNGTSWPNVKTSIDTLARAVEAYNGTTLDVSFTGFMSGTTLTLTTASTDLQGIVQTPSTTVWFAPVVSGGVATGTVITSSASSTSFSLNISNSIGSSGSPVTFSIIHGNAYKMASLLLGRGWKVVSLAQIYNAAGTYGTMETAFRDDIINHLQTDLGNPANHRVVDLASITVGGKFILGTDAALAASTYYSDGLHPLLAGATAEVSGADTPANGLRAAAAMP